MSIKVVTALFAAELTVGENGSVSITATPQEQSEDFFVPLATGMYLDIFATILRLWKEDQSIYEDLLLYRC